ncbi:F-box domain [Dillenia turbinata]|uniref:F-box domain n=1 Tax=Dillenia turbinata TaxID=194707 RepID=A0AAN8VGY9_9MAGN
MAFVLAAPLDMASNNPNNRIRRSILPPSPNQNHQIISGTCIDDVPDDLMIEIFSSFPTKQAIKLKLVSTKWWRIISSRLFARAHLSKTPVHFIGKQMNASWPPRCLRLIKLKGMATEEYDNDLERMIKLSPTSHLPNISFTLGNSCDGLLCLAGKPPKFAFGIFISNPILREFVKLPKPQTYDHDVSHVALGYNPRSDEYKVIRTFRQFVDEVNGLSHHKWGAEIYTLGSRSPEWRYLGDTEWPLPNDSSGEFLNGCLHWTDETCLQALRRFSFVEEEFNIMKAPCRYEERDYKVVGRVNVAVLNTSLCVSNYVDQFESIDVWTMKEYGKQDTWVMMYRIRTGEGGLSLYGPLAISENGFVVFHIKESRFILLEPENEFLYPAFTGRTQRIRFNGFRFFPSVVSLKSYAGRKEFKDRPLNETLVFIRWAIPQD